MGGIKKIVTIGKALLSDAPVEESWYKERIAICSSCEDNSANITKEKWSLATKVKNDVRPGEPVCTACGCWINAKAGVRSEVCGKIKKNEKPLWPALEIQDQNEKGLKVNNLSPETGSILNEGPVFVVNLKKNKETVILFEFEATHSKGFHYESSMAGCMCTVNTVEQVNSKTCKFFVKINTINFDSGLTERSLEIKYSSGKVSKKMYVKFRYFK